MQELQHSKIQFCSYLMTTKPNINDVIMLLFLQTGICAIFGGCLRDLIAGNPSNDIDLIFETFPDLDFIDGKYINGFELYIKSTLEPFGFKIINIMMKTTPRKEKNYTVSNSWNKHKVSESDSDSDTEYERYINTIVQSDNTFTPIECSSEELLTMIRGNVKCKPPRHQEFTITASLGDDIYTFTIDCTQQKYENISKTKPPTLQDTLWLKRIDTPIDDIINSTDTNEKKYQLMLETVIRNVESFIPDIDVKMIVNDTKNKKYVIYNLAHKKRFLKFIKKYILPDIWTIKTPHEFYITKLDLRGILSKLESDLIEFIDNERYKEFIAWVQLPNPANVPESSDDDIA